MEQDLNKLCLCIRYSD